MTSKDTKCECWRYNKGEDWHGDWCIHRQKEYGSLTKSEDVESTWKEDFEKLLPLIVEDYQNFITETGGEIGELDIEEIVSERVLPFLEKFERRIREECGNKELREWELAEYLAKKEGASEAIREVLRQVDANNEAIKFSNSTDEYSRTLVWGNINRIRGIIESQLSHYSDNKS
jgi:hypothetical protein